MDIKSCLAFYVKILLENRDYQIASVAETAIMDVYPYSAEPDDKPEV